MMGEIPERGPKRFFSFNLRRLLVVSIIALGVTTGAVATSQATDPTPAKANTPPSGPVAGTTPQVDINFSPATVAPHAPSTLTLTITNTTGLSAKTGWTFVDTMPSGLTFTNPTGWATTCLNQAGTSGSQASVGAAGNGSVLTVIGSLPAGQLSCTVSVNVSANTVGNYVNSASDFSAVSGVAPNGSSTLNVTANAPLGCSTSSFYNLGQDAKIYSVNPTTGANTVANSDFNAAGLAAIPNRVSNSLGISPDGTKAYVTYPVAVGNPNVVTVYQDDITTGTVTTSGSVTMTQSSIAGAVDPANGIFYFGGWSGGNTFVLYALLSSGPTQVASITQVGADPTQIAGMSNGDLAFDSLGNLYLLGSPSVLSNASYVLRVNSASVPETAGANPATMSVLATLPATGAAYNGLVIGANGLAYAQSANAAGATLYAFDSNTGSQVGSPVTQSGLPVANNITVASDLANCDAPATLEAQKDIASRANSSDQFTLTITRTDGSIGGGNVGTTSGSTTGLQTGSSSTAGPVIALPGKTYTVTESGASGANLANYTTTWTCDAYDANGVKGANYGSGSGAVATVVFPGTLPSPAPNVNCIFTNTAKTSTPFVCSVPTVFDANSSPTVLQAQYQNGGGSAFTPPIGTNPGWTYNAIAYNTANNLIYAVSAASTVNTTLYPNNHLLIIDSTGTIHDLGALTGVPVGDGSASQSPIFNLGAFDGNGTLWIGKAATAFAGTSANGRLFSVNLSTLAVTQLAGQTAPINANDITWQSTGGTSGFFWGASNLTQNMVRVATATNGGITAGTVSSFDGSAFLHTGPAGSSTAGIYGAAWTYQNGNLGFDENIGGLIQVSVTGPATASPTFSLIASAAGPASGNNDGTSCGSPANMTIVKSGPATVLPGGTVNWNLTATNSGPGISSGFVVKDTVPSAYTGVTIDSVTVTNGGAAQTLTPAQAGCTLTGNVVNCVYGAGQSGFAVGATYVVNLHAVAPTAAQCLTNTASVLGNEQTNGTKTSNSQTCVQIAPSYTIKKVADATQLNVDGTVKYTLTITNTGGAAYTAANPASFSDDLSDVLDNATYVAGSAASNPSGWTFTGPTANVLGGSGPLAVGASVTVTYSVKVASPQAAGSDFLLTNVVTPGSTEEPAFRPPTARRTRRFRTSLRPSRSIRPQVPRSPRARPSPTPSSSRTTGT
jgi:fimbrial isopeptide formation D2 family protein